MVFIIESRGKEGAQCSGDGNGYLRGWQERGGVGLRLPRTLAVVEAVTQRR